MIGKLKRNELFCLCNGGYDMRNILIEDFSFLLMLLRELKGDFSIG